MVAGSFSRRLTTQATLTVAIMGILVIVGLALAGLHLFANGINREAQIVAARGEPVLVLAQRKSVRDIEPILERLDGAPTLNLLLMTSTTRSFITEGTNGRTIASESRRHDEAHDPQHHPLVPTIWKRIEAASELLAGLQEARSSAGNVVLEVSINPHLFSEAMRLLFAVAGIAIPIVVAASYLFARRLTRVALQPLMHVTRSLRRLGDGDLRLQTLEESGDIEFRELAVSYNAAVTQVAKAMEQQEQSQSQMRRFVADAGHQLRTPLTVIRGFAAVLLKGDGLSSIDFRRSLKAIEQQSLSMGSLVEKMIILDAWDSDVISPEPCDIRDTIDRIAELFRAAWPDRAINVVGDPMFVEIDSLECTHIMTNVIENALKYTASTIDVTISEQGCIVAVSVSDAGPGMSAEEATRAFDRFYRGLRREVAGSGLGLAIAQRAVERARGSIELETGPDRGTTVTIGLRKSSVPQHAFA